MDGIAHVTRITRGLVASRLEQQALEIDRRYQAFAKQDKTTRSLET
jgi:hypothetical protein